MVASFDIDVLSDGAAYSHVEFGYAREHVSFEDFSYAWVLGFLEYLTRRKSVDEPECLLCHCVLLAKVDGGNADSD